MTPALRRIALMAVALVASGLVALSPPAQAAEVIADVHRFWSPRFDNAHFFTASKSEADHIRATDSNWTYEGIAFRARLSSGGSCSSGSPVYRFYSSHFGSHFYTMSQAEANHIRATDSNWTFEGVAYCADAASVNGSTPLYRFWSPEFGKHFFTADGAEANYIRATDSNWNYEGIAYYVNPGSAPTPTTPPPTTPPPTPPAPHVILGLAKWKLTLPIGAENAPTEIKQPQLATYQHSQWFLSNTAGDGVVFRANAGGATTSGSDYPRSELREMADGTGNNQAAWSNATGTHSMTVTEAITVLPPNKPHVIAAQIHGGTDIDGPIIYVRLEGSKLFVKRGTNVTNSNQFVPVDNTVGYETLTSSYTLGTKFTVWLEAGPTLVNGGPGVQVKYWPGTSTSGTPKIVQYTGVTGDTTYFKAGCYTQSNTSTDAASAYGEVVIYPPLTVTP